MGGLGPLYVVSLIFGLSQGGIIPSNAVVLREFVPAGESASRIGFVVGTSIVGMALGGWMAGWIHTISGSYRAAVINAIAWNVFHLVIVGGVLLRLRRGQADTANPQSEKEAVVDAAP